MMTAGGNDRLRVLSVLVDRVDPSSALSRITGLLKTGGCKHVVTLNPEYVMRAERDSELRRIINGAELTVPDGIGIVWASRLLGEPLPDRVTGTGMLPKLCSICADEGLSVFLLGGGPGVADAAGAELVRMYPKLEIAGSSSRDPDPALDELLVEEINSSGAQLLAVAYGCPKQDLWIDRNRDRLTQVKVAIGVGGAFDFISGQIPRAPRFMRRTGTEWLFRLWIEPSRVRRMVVLPRFGWKVLRSRKKRS
jgi:N-acetylglucosaminyldiphosphoundecaprenol N-acetyl-beta-D-mannosaminyltransferase